MYKIGLTIGDINGIGPEVILKSLSQQSFDNIEFFIFAHKQTIDYIGQKLKLDIKNKYQIIDLDVLDSIDPIPKFGSITQDSGIIAYKSIEKALYYFNDKKIDGIVTAPISKKALDICGYKYSGHTEILQSFYPDHNAQMLFVSETLKLFTLTRHIPLRKVPDIISRELIIDNLVCLSKNLRQDFCIKDPKLAICALNPHAGEEGTIGKEEKEIIIPAVEYLQAESVNISGPFPADSFWSGTNDFDCVIALYHDQGLIPVKLLCMHGSINVTLGLPVIRTSPCHGTAFDIAGKFIANPNSFVESIKMTKKIVVNRNKQLCCC